MFWLEFGVVFSSVRVLQQYRCIPLTCLYILGNRLSTFRAVSVLLSERIAHWRKGSGMTSTTDRNTEFKWFREKSVWSFAQFTGSHGSILDCRRRILDKHGWPVLVRCIWMRLLGLFVPVVRSYFFWLLISDMCMSHRAGWLQRKGSTSHPAR